MMKFEDMKYERPDFEKMKKQAQEFSDSLLHAESFEEADQIFRKRDTENRHIETLFSLAEIRHDIDTRDEKWTKESDWWHEILPMLAEFDQSFTKALVQSEFRNDFAEKYGDLMFVNADIELKSFSPALIEDMQKENKLSNEYEDLLAAAKVSFEGKDYTLSQMELFQNDSDDERRLQAWVAVGQWYKDNEPVMDRIYDELVHLRDAMGKKMGYEGYTTLGYYRMNRNCYTKEDLAKFREAVVKYVVPVASEIYKVQAERLGKSYPLSFADAELQFRSGNPTPVGTAEDIVNAASKFYHELSPETDAFFKAMRENNTMSLLSTEGKRGGGYCTTIPDYHIPFIFSNFNGTQGDVDVVTHEAGHAFEAYLNIDRVPETYIWPSSEACEVHSMSMEFFGEEWAEAFFGKDANKYRYAHLANCLKFIPYGTLVDHFQHEVYAHPEMTPRERHDTWKRLMGVYMPWMKLNGEIPFFADGEHWQLKHHIYSNPFYYIDYCLAQTVALEFWAMIREDRDNAWTHYMAYTKQGGSRTFTDLLKNAGLESPFEEDTLKGVCEKASAYLAAFNTKELH